MFDIINLTVSLKSENRKIVDNISLEIDHGKSLIVLGQSGSGKTMIFRAVFGLLDKRRFDVGGEILFEKNDILRIKPKERRKIFGGTIAFIPQNPMTAFDPSVKIGKQLTETRKIHGGTECKTDVLNALKKSGLNDPERVFGSYPFMLSGGMLQRAAFAAALMNSPKLIIADEPTTALDAEHKIAAIEALSEIRKSGTAIIMVTHDFVSAQRLGGNSVIMRNGKFVENGEINAIMSAPQNDYTKELISSALI